MLRNIIADRKVRDSSLEMSLTVRGPAAESGRNKWKEKNPHDTGVRVVV